LFWEENIGKWVKLETRISRKRLIKEKLKIFAKIEWKDTSKNPTGSKNNL
jgi:hypothetical protein